MNRLSAKSKPRPKNGEAKWQELSTTSHYQTAVAIGEALDDGDVADARLGIEELIDALARSEKRALRSQLVRLMMHVIKWKAQPERRSGSWLSTIHGARREIEDIQEETPSLTKDVVKDLWDKCFRAAKQDAETEMGKKSNIERLTWAQVFEHEYKLDD
jgi:hypothetical protein